MHDSAPEQQFRINALHGNDVGVFVCEASGILLSPCLFMQSICPDPPPRPLLVKWKKSVSPPKSFRPSGTLPLIYSDCGRDPRWHYYLHLFALQLPVAGVLEKESDLQDWTFSVRMLGIVLIFDRKHDDTLSYAFFNWLSNRNKQATPKKNPSLSWVRAQQLPYVIAALGYDDAPSSEHQFRSIYGIAADIPVVPGPALTDEKRLNLKRKSVQTSSNTFSSLFEPQKLAFDGEHARRVLVTLYKLIERK